MSLFKRRRFPVEIILLCVRWYCKYGISYRDLAEMMSERGISVSPSTIFRWVQRYAPEIEKRVRPYQGHRSGSWRVDETYVRVGGRWRYLFRAVDKHGRLIASMLAGRRDTGAAYRFLRKALRAVSDYPPHQSPPTNWLRIRKPSGACRTKGCYRRMSNTAPRSISTTSSRRIMARSSG